MLNLSNKSISRMSVDLPDSDIQLALLDKIENVKRDTSKLRNSFREKLTAIANLRQSLLQKAFAGELV